ncbi:hypothetical protein AGMMS49587_00450 [Spirochaetia bacterium]|nr:hypothetical protein AGMMS49587_00450 [Spirochaetia bacterium]
MAIKTINTKGRYHEEIKLLWENQKESIKNNNKKLKKVMGRGAFLEDKLYTDTILFLGIGSSHDGEDHGTCEPYDNINYHNIAKSKASYYKAIEEIVGQTKFKKWSHIDLTLLRETKQKSVESFYKDNYAIMREQNVFAIKMIKQSKPKLIVASNAFVRKILQNEKVVSNQPEFGLGFEFSSADKVDEKTGTYIITKPLANVPVFFTRMLSGQGQLDIGSRERLIWHINYVCKVLKIN